MRRQHISCWIIWYTKFTLKFWESWKRLISKNRRLFIGNISWNWVSRHRFLNINEAHRQRVIKIRYSQMYTQNNNYVNVIKTFLLSRSWRIVIRLFRNWSKVQDNCKLFESIFIITVINILHVKVIQIYCLNVAFLLRENIYKLPNSSEKIWQK